MSDRRPYVAGNWKMNTTLDEAITLADGLKRRIGRVRAVESYESGSVYHYSFASLRTKRCHLSSVRFLLIFQVQAQNLSPRHIEREFGTIGFHGYGACSIAIVVGLFK